MYKKKIKPSAKNHNRRESGKKSAKPAKHANTRIVAIEGKLDMNRQGYGFVINAQRPGADIIIRQQNLGSAINGDKVLVQITNEYRGKAEGKIIKILERAYQNFSGIAHVKKDFAFVLPDDKYGMSKDIYVPNKYINGAKDGERVIVKISDWNEQGKNPFGIITDILTGASLKEVMWKTILMDNGFNLEFPKAVLDEVKAIKESIPNEEIAKRKDFRKITTFTIDPADAKDFDDALSYQLLENGNHEVGIHIADVSHYVKPGTALDTESIERTTSVYMVDGTLPMLPEKISNELCSLRPNEDKLCFSAVFELNAQAAVVKEWFGRTIIHSNKRFTYENAQEVLDAGKGDFANELKTLNELAYKLRAKRFKEGSINFDSVETKFKLDADGKPIGIVLKERKDTNLLIEDFMLLANKQVATFIAKKIYKGKNIPFPYRIHDLPDMEKLKNFNLFAKPFGYRLNLTTPFKIAESFNEMIVKLKGKPEESMLTSLGIRCMAKAVYSTNNIGHYGLGFPNYAHFTSPIRRYPDVLVHRILAEVLLDEKLSYTDNLEALCKRCSEREKKASESERESIKYKQAEFLSTQVGKVFEGIISGVTNFGIFVELIENKCEGMVSVRKMPETFIHDEKSYTLTGKETGTVYTLGDKVKVIITKSNPEKKEIDMQIVED